jgi:uncharacterized OB-fold protein
MKILEPPISDAAIPFWDATRAREFVLPWCVECARPMWYPRDVCPACLGSEIEWRPASGDGEVYAVGVHSIPGPGRDRDDIPYAVVLVELAEGVRMMTNVVNVDATTVTVGMPVRITWLPLSDGRNLPQFEPRERPSS